MNVRRRGTNRVDQRYVCTVDGCDGHQMIPVHPSDTDDRIRYVCEECIEVTEHKPAGKNRLVLIPG